MKITQLNSATNMIEDSVNDTCVKILCDPWLDGEEYLGSWAIYPQYNFKPENFSNASSNSGSPLYGFKTAFLPHNV